MRLGSYISLKRTARICLFIAILLTTGSTLFAQKKPASIWASAYFNKKEVIVGEPLVVTIKVYTSTWFTEPPVFSEIQVAGALMVRLQQRSGAGTTTIGNKRYPTIEQRFVVYPNIVGENVLPSFEIITNCPPEGDYKGIEREVFTKERKFTVLAPPGEIDTSQWLSAYSLSLSDTWDKPLDNLKTGDVLERRIRVRAGGALAALIPPIELDSIPFGKTYPKTPILGNSQNKSSFSGSRTEIITYLIEEDGTFEIPAIEVAWFNLSSRQLERKIIDPISIQVAANPDLEFILSQQKALQEALANELPQEVEDDKPFEFLGLNWWQLILVITVVIAVIRLFISWIRRLQDRIRVKKEEEYASEAHYFKQLKQSLEQGDPEEMIRQLFFWYDRFREENYDATLLDFVSKIGDKQLLELMEEISISYYGADGEIKTEIHRTELIQRLSEARKKSTAVLRNEQIESWLEINPK